VEDPELKADRKTMYAKMKSWLFRAHLDTANDSGPVADVLYRQAYVAAYDRQKRHPAWVRAALPFSALPQLPKTHDADPLLYHSPHLCVFRILTDCRASHSRFSTQAKCRLSTTTSSITFHGIRKCYFKLCRGINQETGRKTTNTSW
jgi:hypothetical protein